MSDKMPWELLEDAVRSAERLPLSRREPLHLSIVIGWICFGLGFVLVWVVPMTGGTLLALAAQFGFFGLVLGRDDSLPLFAASVLLGVGIAGVMEFAVDRATRRMMEPLYRDVEKILENRK